MRHHAKSCVDWSNLCRDIAIFGFFGMAAAASLTHATVKNVKFRKSKKAAAAVFKTKTKNHISAAVRAISTKFSKVVQFDILDRSDC